MLSEDWRKNYKDAYLAANKIPCELEWVGKDKFRISAEGCVPVVFSKKTILQMTETLLQRVL